MKDKKVTNKTFVMTAVIGSLLIMALVTVKTLRFSKQTAMATDKAVSAVSSFYLDAMADRRAKTITNLISNSFDQMEKAVEFITDENIGSQEELREKIGKVKDLLGLKRFALVDEDNIVYTQYTTYTGRSRHPFLTDGQLNDRIISTVSLYGSSKQLFLAIPTPDLYIMGKHFKACFVQYDINDIVDLLAFDDNGRTYFALYSENGGNLSGTDLGPVIADRNLFDVLKDIVPDEVWAVHYDNFANETEGTLSFALDDMNDTLSYVPIEGTGWEMVVLIHESVIYEQFRDISEKNIENNRNLIIFTLVSVVLLAVVLLFMFHSLTRAKLEAEKENSNAFRNMATTDSMTGVRNKHAYTENEALINGQIHSGELNKLAVIVCDVNGLKHVNDTKGHAAGDQLIKDACALLCEQFIHGAVFRIGGDEFAVLLQGKGYDKMKDVIAETNRMIEENIEKDGVVISIGYAVLEPGDKHLRDVFERADQMMYERKKELKAMGAVTRG